MTIVNGPPARDDDPRRASIARSSMSLLAANVGGGIFAFAFVVIIARTIGPTGRGVVAFATTVPTVLSWLTIMGLDVAFLYLAGARPALRPAIASGAVATGIVTGIVGSILGAGILALFPGLAPDEVTRSMLLTTLIATPLFSVQRLLNTTLIGSRRIWQANAVVVSIPAVSLVTFLTLGLAGSFSVHTAIAAWVTGRFVGAMASVVLTRRHIGLIGDVAAIRSALRPSIGYGLRAYPASLSALPIRRFDTFLLAAIAPASELGLYTAGVNIAEVAMYLPNSVANVLLPEGAGRSERESALMVKRASAVVLSIMLIGATIAILAAPLIVDLVLGRSFTGTILPLQLMMIAMVGSSSRRIYSAGLMARDRAGAVSALTVITMIMIVALDVALIPGLGASGAALASAIGYSCGGALMYGLYRRSLSEPVERSLPPLKQELIEGFSTLWRSIPRRGRRAVP
jgi:O-antigen/teichoic acid export membrane protein